LSYEESVVWWVLKELNLSTTTLLVSKSLGLQPSAGNSTHGIDTDA